MLENKIVKHFSLEEQMVEPFRAIRSFDITFFDAIFAAFFFSLSMWAWWFGKEWLSQFWSDFLREWISSLLLSWSVKSGHWPSPELSVFESPELLVSVMSPDRYQWWVAVFGCGGIWWLLGYVPDRAIPLRVTIRYWLLLFTIALVWFSFSPLRFHHSIQEWTKIYFLVSFLSLPIYFFLWSFGVLLFPISFWVKLIMTLCWLGFSLIAIPLIILVSTSIVEHFSLMLLPLLTLGIVPVFQLGWFVAFYSIALSTGVRK